MDTITAGHRRAQLALRAATLRELLRIWPSFDLARIGATWPSFEDATLLLIQARGRLSATLAARYYREHRLDAGVTGSPPVPRATPTETEIRSGLRVVGPVEAGSALALGRRAEEVAKNTLVKLSGATGMYVLDFGRDTLMNLVHDDAKALGWARQTAGAPCSFCAMLAGRGPVYRSEQSASFESHRGCACTPVPQWSKDQEWPEGSRELQQSWRAATRGLSGTDALNAFRRSLEGR